MSQISQENYNKFAFKKAGYKPPAALLQRLNRLHPHVRLIWNPFDKNWGLAERTKFGWVPICWVGPKLTLDNTLTYLNKHDARQGMKRAFINGFLSDLESEESTEQDLDTAMITEGSERLEHGLRKLT